MYEFDEGAELSKYFYEPKEIETANGLYVANAAEKQRLEEKQGELSTRAADDYRIIEDK
jgi:hypothetical protein